MFAATPSKIFGRSLGFQMVNLSFQGIASDLKELEDQLKGIPDSAHRVLAAQNGALYLLDLIIVGAAKRSLNHSHGLISMVNARNMACARAIVRMHIDTVSRLLAYTYVDDPEEMASKVIGGTPLNKFKTRDGHKLRDAYLIDTMTKSHPWVRDVYDRTSGEVHFSEQQLFASIQSLNDSERTLQMMISPIDEKYPEFSWTEVVKCFHELNEILVRVIDSYAAHKTDNKSSRPTPNGAA